MSELTLFGAVHPAPVDGVEYRLVPGLDGYMVGSDGSFWSRRSRNGIGTLAVKWRAVIGRHDRKGYRKFCVRSSVYGHSVMAHHLVLIAFVGPRVAGMHGCHNNGVTSDNRVENLRWDTPSGNNKDKIKHGTRQVGEAAPHVILTQEQVDGALRRLAKGEFATDIAKSLGVDQSAISLIKRGRNWSVTTDAHLVDAARAGSPSSVIGSRHYKAKLTEIDVSDIRWLSGMGLKGGALAKEYGVSPATISEILHCKAWRHV